MNTETATSTAAPPQGFEKVACSRCGGSGRHSYCQMYRDVCFKCGGSGQAFTARGAAANKFYIGLLSRKASELAVGDTVRWETMGGKWRWYKLEKIEASSTPGQLALHSLDHGGMSYHVQPDRVFRVAHSVEQKRAAYASALAFQATLTKQGKPRKR